MASRSSEGIQVDRRHWIHRHALVIRITHWINAFALTILLMSGLQIFNAHPALYWGAQSDFSSPILEMKGSDDGSTGTTTIFTRSFDTTGLLGASIGPDGSMAARGFPGWITIPGEQALATGRRWHFFFAWLLVFNGLVYLAYGLLTRHLRRDLAPTGPELRHIPRSILDHLRLRFPHGDEARRYNVLQKLSYLIVIFGLLPVMILAGLTMSPAMDAAFPQLLWLFGGRQTARTVHFILAWTIVLFAIVHVLMVVLSGFWNNVRSMFTGRYDIEHETETSDVEKTA